MDLNSLLIFKLIFDAGLLVLIWLVQLIIYPGFTYYNSQDLERWHTVYTDRITIVVLPLMLSQLILSCWIAYTSNLDILLTINALLVILTWISTFITFVPLHQKIDSAHQDSKASLNKLVNLNWIRTFLWTVIFVLTLIKLMV